MTTIGPEQPDSKARILSAAEKLFGDQGFDGTSLRDITSAAQVNLAAINYYFQSKDSLIDAVIERRIGPVNRRRVEMLDAAGPTPTLEQIIEAFLAPITDRDMAPAMPLMARVLSNPQQFLDRVYRRHLMPILHRFAEELHKVLPELSHEECIWRIHFMAGGMSHVIALTQVLPLAGVDPSDRSKLVTRMVPFFAAAFRAPATEKS